MSPTIRSATPADLPAILAIYNHAVIHTTASYDLEPSTLVERIAWYDDRMRKHLPVLVAECNGQVAGFGSYGPFRDKVGYRYSVEHSVYVAPEQHRQGIGRALLVALIADARTRRMHVMLGGIDAENAGSLDFHRALGFAEVARFHEVGHKFDRWLDVIFVELRL